MQSNPPNSETPTVTWIKLERATTSNIISESAKATLIKVPGDDWLFWMPSKLVREKKTHLTISIPSTMTFKAFKNGKGQYNKFQKIAEKELTALQLEELWNEPK